MKFMVKAAILATFALWQLGIQASTVEEELRQIATATQKGLPMEVQDGIQATSMNATGKVMLARYHYMMKSSEIRDVNTVKNDFQKSALNSSCTHPSLSKLLTQGAYWKYEFYDIDNRFVFGFDIDKGACSGINSNEPEKIYRCGGEYKNTVTNAEAKNCILIAPRRSLSEIEKGQFSRCKLKASKAPTEMGVKIGLDLCKGDFDQ